MYMYDMKTYHRIKIQSNSSPCDAVNAGKGPLWCGRQPISLPRRPGPLQPHRPPHEEIKKKQAKLILTMDFT